MHGLANFGGAVMLVAAAFVFIYSFHIRAGLAWEKRTFGIDRTRVISNWSTYHGAMKFLMRAFSLVMLGVAIFLFCQPTLAARRSERERQRQQAIEKRDEARRAERNKEIAEQIRVLREHQARPLLSLPERMEYQREIDRLQGEMSMNH